MGLPPGNSKFSTDTNPVTTFFWQFPNFTGSHSGVTATVGTNSVAGGGTGDTTLTANNLLVGAGTSPVTFIAPGTSGNILQSNGTTWNSVANAVTPAVGASYYCSVNQTTTSGNPINFDTSTFDTNSAVTTGSSWKFTAPYTGYYQITMSSSSTATSSTILYQIYKNGSIFNGSFADGPTADVYPGVGAYTISLNAGDYVDVRPNVSTTISGGALTAINTSWINVMFIPGNNSGSGSGLTEAQVWARVSYGM
jgi:hypothetical protein